VKDKRREARYFVDLAASFRNASGASRAIKVRNLSARGCRFATSRRMGVGDYLTITIGNLGFIDAQVKWRSGNVHGVRFAQPLHPAVLDHLRLFLSAMPALLAEGEEEQVAVAVPPLAQAEPEQAPQPSFYSVLTRVLLGEEFR
jgi:hypothetical protein